MNPPAMTNSTKMPFAVTRLVVQNALTCAFAVRSGVDNTVWPRVSMTGFNPVFAIHSRKSLIALRICPGMSNSPGSSSPESDGGVQPGGVGPCVGAGVLGAVGVGVLVGGGPIGLGVVFGVLGAGFGLGRTPGSGTPVPGVGAGVGSAHAGLAPVVTAAPARTATPSITRASRRVARCGRLVRETVGGCMATSPTRRRS